MGKIKSILGYSWAFLAFVIVPVTFLGNAYFSQKLASATGVTVSPLYSGGEIVRIIDHGAYRTSIHRPVFDALIGETKTGFVQINWEPSAGLPAVIREGLDYNGDNREDFIITLDTATGEATLAADDPAVLSLGKTYKLRKGWAVRVLLKNRS
ncbi:MAG: hypothetical protein L7F78_18595 [Syntrophales bacterium LBB04]|nr:hypothetical protein [Syntrophales bacterium LBB04]